MEKAARASDQRMDLNVESARDHAATVASEAMISSREPAIAADMAETTNPNPSHSIDRSHTEFTPEDHAEQADGKQEVVSEPSEGSKAPESKLPVDANSAGSETDSSAAGDTEAPQTNWWDTPVGVLKKVGNWVIESFQDANASTEKVPPASRRQAEEPVFENEVNVLVEEIINQVQLRTEEEFNAHKAFLEKEQGIAIRTADVVRSHPSRVNMTTVLRTIFDRFGLREGDKTELMKQVVPRISKMNIPSDKLVW